MSIVVVGIGADGWAGLTDLARRAVLSAEEVIGSDRQLAMLPAHCPPRRPLPSPLAPFLDSLPVAADRRVCILASGDPMLHGIGSSLARRLGPRAIDSGQLTVISHPSALALACARLGWPEAEVTLVSAVAEPISTVARVLQPGRLVIAYVTGTGGATQVAQALCARGFGASELTVLEQLGGPGERIRRGAAGTWGTGAHDPLAVVAIRCLRDADGDTAILPTVPGLPDDAYEHDGALTKRHVRAATLAALAPAPGALLWDIGAGSGSIGIEWLRAEPTARAIAIEPRGERAARAARNAAALGVPRLQIVNGDAPRALEGLDAPDAIFIGGGLSDSVLGAAWDALLAGGRLVANAVTAEGERLLLDAASRHGGELVKLSVSHLEPLGSFTAWRPALPIVQWSASKPR